MLEKRQFDPTRLLRSAAFASIVVLLIGIILLLVDDILLLDQFLTEQSVSAQMLRELGLILCSIGIISILYETLIRRQLIKDYNAALVDILDPDSRRLGIGGIFLDRDDKVSRGRALDVLLRSARQEMFCFGLGFYEFLPERRDLLRAKLRDGCVFRFLMFDAESEAACALDQSLGLGNGSLIAFLQAQRRYFADLQSQLARDGVPPGRFQVRLYQSVPVFGGLCLDPGLPNCRMFVELYGSHVEGSTCPGLELFPKDNGWHNFYVRQMMELWDEAKPLTLSTPTSKAERVESGVP